jgi:hypothetical protein
MKKRWKVSIFNFLLPVLLALAACFAPGPAVQAAQPAVPPWDTADTGWISRNTGESYDPYVISTADELAGLAKLVGEGNAFRYKYFVLANDIDLGGREWFPIGSFDSYLYDWFKAFSATFDGRGHRISGINTSSGRYGNLFGYIENSGAVKNLVAEGRARGSGTASDGAAILTAWLDGTVENCVVSGDVTAGVTGGYRCYTGMVASLAASGKIRNVITFGTVNALSGMSYAAGILGYTYSNGVVIENCSVNVSSIRSVMSAGGIVGSNLGLVNAIYNNVSAAQSVTASSPSGPSVGGIMGYAINRFGANNYWLKTPGNDNQPDYFDMSGYSAGKVTSAADLPIVSVWPLEPIALDVSDTLDVDADLYPNGGSDAGLTFTWTSSKPGVASVTGSGASARLTGVAEGTTTLTLRMSSPAWSGRGWVSVSCPVTVGSGGGDTEQPPSAPVGLTATPGENQVTLAWSAPLSDGGAAITGYEASDGTSAEWVALESGVTTYTFAGLKTGTDYEFAVRAVNAAGAGASATATAATAGAGGAGPAIPSENAVPAAEKAFIAMDLDIPEDLFVVDAEGNLTLDAGEALAIARETWPGAEFEPGEIVMLPIVRAAVDRVGGLAEFRFPLKGSALRAERPEDALVLKFIGSHKAGSFSYAASAAEYGDKKFTVLKDGDIYAHEIEPDADYTLVLFVADNGGFDSDRTYLSVRDPSGIFGKPENFDSQQPSPASSGGGGCAALGFPAFLAFLAVIPLLRGGRRRG